MKMPRHVEIKKNPWRNGYEYASIAASKVTGIYHRLLTHDMAWYEILTHIFCSRFYIEICDYTSLMWEMSFDYCYEQLCSELQIAPIYKIQDNLDADESDFIHRTAEAFEKARYRLGIRVEDSGIMFLKLNDAVTYLHDTSMDMNTDSMEKYIIEAYQNVNKEL